MGSFGGGFLEAVGNRVAQKADEEHQQEMQRKKLLGDSYLRAISQIGNADGSPLTDAQKQQISTYQDEYDKLYGKSKGMKDALQKVRHITGMAMGHPNWGKQNQPAAQTGAAQPAASATPGLPPPPGASAPVDPDKQIVSGKAASAASDRADSPLVQPNWTPPPGVQAPAPGGDQKKNDVASPADAAMPPSPAPSPAPTPADSSGKADSATAAADAKEANTPAPLSVPDASTPTEKETPSSDALLKSITRGGVLPPPPLPPAPAPLPPPNFAPAVPPPPGHPPNIEPWVQAYRIANPSLDEQNARAFEQQERIRAMNAKYKIQELEAQAKAQAAKPSNARAVEGHPIAPGEAISMAEQGFDFPTDPTGPLKGAPIDVGKLLPGSALYPVYKGGGQTYWRIGSQTGRTVGVGNTTYGEGNLDVAGGLHGATAMGPRYADRNSSHQVRGAQGQVDTLHNNISYAPSVTPGTVVGGEDVPRGMIPPNSTTPPPQHSTPNSNRFSSGQPVTDNAGKIPEPPAGRQPKASPASVPPAPRDTPSSGGKLHLTPAEYNQERQIVTPVREAVTQIFGDPSSGLEGLTKFGKLYDDPEARRRVANAIALTFGADPESAEKEGLFSILKNQSGVPLALAASQVEAKNQALRQMSGPESDWYNALVGAYGAAVGLRSLTKASGAQASVRRIEQELPLPDMYTNSSRAFYDRMSKLAEMVYNGTRTLSDQGPMGPAEKERYHGLVKQMLDRKKAVDGRSANSTARKTMTPPPGSAKPIKTAAELLQKYEK